MKIHLSGWKNILKLQSWTDQGAEAFRAPWNEPLRDGVGVSCLAILGLLCHVLIFWLLSFPYVYRYDPYLATDRPSSGGIVSITTGWHALGGILILPVFFYLACLLPGLRKNKKLEKGMYLNVLVNLGGFIILYGLLLSSRIGDFNHQTTYLDAAYGVHLTSLIIAVLCSSVMSVSLGFWLWQRRKLLINGSL